MLRAAFFVERLTTRDFGGRRLRKFASGIASSLAISCAIVISGCALADYRKLFEEANDSVIGQVVDRTRYVKPHWAREVTPQRIEYGYRDYRGCSYALEIDKQSRVVLAWRYLSEPSLCWTYVPTA